MPTKKRTPMKETLRRNKSTKSADLGTNNEVLRTITNGSQLSSDDSTRAGHQRSVSNASVMAGGIGEKNPWDDGASVSTRTDTSFDGDGRGRAPNLEVPGSVRSERSVSEKPTRRRKKTLNQVTPHRFELVDAKRDSMRPPVPTDSRSRSATPTEDLVVSRTRGSRRTSSEHDQVLGYSKQHSVVDLVPEQARPQRKMFSRIRICANIVPVDPPPRSRSRSRSRSPPYSARRNNGFTDDFMSDFGMNRAPVVSSPSVTSPTSPNRGAPFAGLNQPLSEPWVYRPPHNPLPQGSLMNRVIVITNGISVISAPIVRALHKASARVIFSVPVGANDAARKFIRELGPPDTLHYNVCDIASYEDIHALFKLGIAMYGRVDHAIFSPEDDGGQVRTVGTGERLWGLDVALSEGRTMSAKAELEIIERGEARDPTGHDMTDIVGASIRFARIALPYLRNAPGRRQKHSTGEALSPVSAGGFTESMWSEDRSLTFITSTAAFQPMPYLPVYTTAQHAILGLVRSLGQSVDVRRDGVRVNLVATNMLLPSVVEAKGGGRMSVRLPGDKGEDVGLIVAGIIGNRNSRHTANAYEDDDYLHGKIFYAVGGEAVDIQGGLDMNEQVWLGKKGKEAWDRASGRAEGLDGKGRWMLMDAVDSPLL